MFLKPQDVCLKFGWHLQIRLFIKDHANFLQRHLFKLQVICRFHLFDLWLVHFPCSMDINHWFYFFFSSTVLCIFEQLFLQWNRQLMKVELEIFLALSCMGLYKFINDTQLIFVQCWEIICQKFAFLRRQTIFLLKKREESLLFWWLGI